MAALSSAKTKTREFLRLIARGYDMDSSPPSTNQTDIIRNGAFKAGAPYSEEISEANARTIAQLINERASRIVQAVFRKRGSSPFGSRMMKVCTARSDNISTTNRIDIKMVMM